MTTHRRMLRVLCAALLGTLLLTGCAAPDIRPFPAAGQVDYQLGAAYPVPDGTTIVARDSTAEPVPGVYSICYVNGFQSQPGDTAEWLERHPDLVLMSGGEPVIDPNWPDEIIFDTAAADRRAAIAAILRPTLERCAKAGFDAVEIDNLDSFARSGGALTANDNIALAKAYAQDAHALGLAIGQKNTVELAGRLRAEVGFDFAVAEECHRFAECGTYRDVYGERMINIEYTDNLRGSFAEACADPDSPRAMMLRDRELLAETDDGYAYEHC